ncbi:MAG: SMI1/KNR4 family protein [Bacteroidetes bacterium]|nr:SMI1/KNR4 family protein [Bacteroidota bacterium]
MEQFENIQVWVENVVSYWMNSGVKLGRGASTTEIIEAEAYIGMSFPKAFVELYKRVDGFIDYDMNQHMVSLWPLQRIREEYEASEDKNFIVFCDWCIQCHHIGFLKNANGIYKSYDEFNPMAHTFEEAIELINDGSDSIY